MNYNEEDKEDKKYKKGYGRKEFKKDVAEAVKPVVVAQGKKEKKKAAAAVSYPTKRSEYSKMSATALRKLLVEKKKKLLMKQIKFMMLKKLFHQYILQLN